MVKPITPKEAIGRKIHSIPDFVISAVNELLSSKVDQSGRAVLAQNEIVDAIKLHCPNEITPSEIFAAGWLDFEPVYVSAGWHVEYDRPGYNETYEPTFAFSKSK